MSDDMNTTDEQKKPTEGEAAADEGTGEGEAA
jgi:hypothetical protein